MDKKKYKIYTKGGDKGQTSLLGGTRVPKYHVKIEAYGTTDELNSYLGLIRDQEIDEQTKNILLIVQEKLFVAEAILASDNDEHLKSLPVITEKDIELLEYEIDRMNQSLPELKKFILPGGHTIVSYCHIARCVCRRAERLAIKCCEESSFVEIVIKYLNRLSDYLFVLARSLGKKLNAVETLWEAQ